MLINLNVINMKYDNIFISTMECIKFKCYLISYNHHEINTIQVLIFKTYNLTLKNIKLNVNI